MEFQYLTDAARTAKADLLAITTFGDPGRDPLFKVLDAALEGGLSEAARAESFEGKSAQCLTLWTAGKLPSKRVMVVGVGARPDLSAAGLRDTAALIAQAANRSSSESVAFVVPPLGAARDATVIQLVVEGAIGGTYKFSRYLTSEDAKKPPSLKRFGLITDAKGGKKPTAAQARAIQASIDRGTAIADAVCKARDMVNEPAAAMTPQALADAAKALAKKHASITVNVLGPKQCEELGMGMFLAVARGSDLEARFIHLTYKPAKKPKKRVALVGKGLTFDSGGYSIKTSQGMEDMKVDMAGAATVINAMDAIATLGCEHEVHAVAACCENMVSGRAYKLGDVLQSMDGTTVEINNTDAEGRLTLGDAITYVRTKIAPDEIFDFATLTGACLVALGPYTAGVMSDHDKLINGWLSSATRAGEEMWRLPLLPRLREQLKSPIADLRNTGDRFGGAITAGLFLKAFAKDTPWVHVDLAGPASVSSGRPSQPRGGTGFAVATIVDYLTQR